MSPGILLVIFLLFLLFVNMAIHQIWRWCCPVRLIYQTHALTGVNENKNKPLCVSSNIRERRGYGTMQLVGTLSFFIMIMMNWVLRITCVLSIVKQLSWGAVKWYNVLYFTVLRLSGGDLLINSHCGLSEIGHLFFKNGHFGWLEHRISKGTVTGFLPQWTN